MSEKEVCYFI